jgi:hypothetical protein
MSTEVMGLVSSRLACAVGMAPHPTEANGSTSEPGDVGAEAVAAADAGVEVVVDAAAVLTSGLGPGDEGAVSGAAAGRRARSCRSKNEGKGDKPCWCETSGHYQRPQDDRRRQQHLY